ncbi:hypothetical protein RB195_025697 [Necator americanus]|uniref:Uncharacterized protein n=1 Tax=Necator americanus TaxID=51031 RepID=A0ABR1ETG8_NECAM
MLAPFIAAVRIGPTSITTATQSSTAQRRTHPLTQLHRASCRFDLTVVKSRQLEVGSVAQTGAHEVVRYSVTLGINEEPSLAQFTAALRVKSATATFLP